MPVYANVEAAAVADPGAIRALLVAQVTGMVRWRESVLAMQDAEWIVNHEAIEGLHRLLEMDPACEPAHAMLMRLLAGRGQRSDALRQYQTCVEALRREIGSAPGFEQEMQRMLADGDRPDQVARRLVARFLERGEGGKP